MNKQTILLILASFVFFFSLSHFCISRCKENAKKYYSNEDPFNDVDTLNHVDSFPPIVHVFHYPLKSERELKNYPSFDTTYSEGRLLTYIFRDMFDGKKMRKEFQPDASMTGLNFFTCGLPHELSFADIDNPVLYRVEMDRCDLRITRYISTYYTIITKEQIR